MHILTFRTRTTSVTGTLGLRASPSSQFCIGMILQDTYIHGSNQYLEEAFLNLDASVMIGSILFITDFFWQQPFKLHGRSHCELDNRDF